MTTDGPCPPTGAVSGAGGSDARGGDPAEPASFEDAVRLLRESRARELALEGRIADLQLAQQDLSAFFDTVDDLLFVLDEQGVMLQVNQAVCRRLGYAREELLGRSVLDVHPPDRRDEAGRIVAAMLAGEAAFCPVPVVTRDGAEIPVETRVVHGVWRGGPALFGVTKDVSALKLSEEKFARAFHSAPTLTAISTVADGRYVDVNDVFLATLGFTREEVVGSTSAELDILVDPGDRDRVLRIVRDQGSARNVEVSFRCKDGAVVLGLLSADPILIGDEPCVLTTALDITERKSAEQALQESEALHRSILSASPENITITDLQGRIRLTSPAAAPMFGYAREEEAVGHVLTEFLVPEDRERAAADIARMYDGVTGANEYGGLRADGRTFAMEVNGEFVRDAQGRPIGMVFIVRDVTARRLAEEELRATTALLSGLLTSIPDIVFFKDEGGVYLGCNPEFARLVGRAVSDVVGATDRDLFDETAAALFAERDRVMLAAGEPRHNEEWIAYPDGEQRLVDTLKAPLKSADGRVIGLLGVSRDITERKSAEEALRESEELLARAMEGSGVGLWDWQVQSGEALFSARWAEILGYALDELTPVIGTWDRLAHADDLRRANELLQQHFAGLLPTYACEVRMRHKDGHWVWVLDRGKVMEWDEKGRPARMTGTHLDISERKAAEEEAARQARLQELLTDLAATYIDLPLDAVETAIDSSLRELGEFVYADRVYIFEYDMAGQTTSNTFEWCGDGTEPAIDDLQQIPFAGLHDWVETHLRGDHLYVPDVGSLPEGTVREILEPQGIKSLLAVPMMCGRSCLGFVGFDSVHHHHEYTEGELRLLSVFGGMLAGVHQRRQADEALHSAAERLALATQAGGVGVWEWDLATDDLIWDEQMLKLYGVGRTDFGGGYAAWQAGLHPDDRERAQSEIQAAVRGEGDFDTEFRIVRPDGTLRTVRAMARVRRDASGGATHVTGTNWDITESRRMEESLRLRESYLTAIIESHPGMVWLKDTESRFLAVNTAFAQSCGQGTPENVMGKTDFDVWPADLAEAYRSDDVRVLADGRPYSVEEPIADKGERRWFETFKTPVADDGGIVLGTTGYAWDITERKRAEEELRDVNRLLQEAVARANELAVEARAATTAKSRFLAHMSHEIRTPLNAIIGFAHLMESDPDLTMGQKDRVGIITRSGEHLLALLSDILELSKVDSGRQHLEEVAFDLHTLLEDLALVFRARAEVAGLAFTYEAAADVPHYAWADQAKLRQIVTNLLGNAVRLTEAGSVCLRVSAADDGAGRVMLTAAVEDSGPGIAADEMDALFAPFEQTRSGRAHGTGTGLGLAISRQFAWLMGGELTVESVPGTGSAFRLQVPIEPREEDECSGHALAPAAVRLEAGQAQCHVVVVDADDDSRALLVELLGGAGFELAAVTESLDARVAVEMRRPRLVIVADSLPETEGFEVVHAIRDTQAGAATKIIVLAAGATDENRDAALRAGADVFMAKPFRAAELFEWVRSLTGVRYEPAAAAPQPPAPAVAPDLTHEMVARLKPELRRALREAAVRARHGHLLELADEVARSDPEAGARLRELLVVFDYAAVLQALGGEGGSDADR